MFNRRAAMATTTSTAISSKTVESSLSWVTQYPSLLDLVAAPPSGLAPEGHCALAALSK
jgi:hypothetical protein